MLLPITALTLAADPCRILSLSGGGAFGAYEAGVLARLTNASSTLDFDYLLGVSAGSLNAAFLSTFLPGPVGLREASAELATFWWKTQDSDIWKFRLWPSLADPSLLDSTPLLTYLTKITGTRSVQRKVSIGITSLATGHPMTVDEDELSKNLTTLLMASSAIPTVFPPVEYNGSRFVDGGLTANVLSTHGIRRCSPSANVEVGVSLEHSQPQSPASPITCFHFCLSKQASP